MERTEDLAHRGVLPVTIGGESVELRTLTIAESDEWLAKLGAVMAGFEIEESDDTGEQIKAVMRASSEVALSLVVDYDVADVLGVEAALRARATRREIHDALLEMVRAEDPFGEDGVRSVVEVLGAPSRLVANELHAELAATMSEAMLRSGASTNGRSPAMASAGASSGTSGRRNSSSSAGRTPRKKTKSD